jgi:transcriptional regulator with XRE-family HTH domain
MAESFGDVLRHYRREARLNLGDLAEAINTSISFVSQVERGLKQPTPNQIQRMLERVGRPEKSDEMIALSAQQQRVFKMRTTSPNLASVAWSLKRRSEDGLELSDEVAAKIIQLLKTTARSSTDDGGRARPSCSCDDEGGD